MWFEKLTGFPEGNPANVREKLSVSGGRLTSLVTGDSWEFGYLEIASLQSLRDRVAEISAPERVLPDLEEVVGSVQDLHLDPGNTGALFQVASQFNLLEMVHPSITPEHGVSGYESDFTQGPACAIAAGAGTIYRNYFAETNGKTGQSAGNQIDCLSDVGQALGNSGNSLWEMRNGYALATEPGLREISGKLKAASPDEREDIRGALKVGIQWHTQVTLENSRHLVSQIYCSALPVAYSPHAGELWEEFAVLVLEAAYEATLCAAALNAQQTGNRQVYLTLLGGGAFGNETDWILGAMRRAIGLPWAAGLQIRMVSHRRPNPQLRRLLRGD